MKKLIKLSQYGAILTGREKGKGIMDILRSELEQGTIIEIDLEGILSMGSSFGDEVFPEIARNQDGAITISNASPSVKHCLNLVASDSGIKIYVRPT